MRTTVRNETRVERTPRVVQLESIFDLPPSETSERTWDVVLPLDERHWNVGLIVGPSGAGKTSVARAAFEDEMVGELDWPDDRAIVDAFPADMPVKDVVGLLSSVGFSSPPAWLRPYRHLSTGEQFRATVARAMAETAGLIVVDEFTSTVDRQVAQMASHTVQKALRRADRRMVAVTCHYDVIDWLQPDWVYQPHSGQFDWRSLQRRPGLELRIHEAGRSAWALFGRYHYLSDALSTAAKCAVGYIGDEPVAFVSWVHTVHPSPKTRNIRNLHRVVVLPDYQGLGIGVRLADWAAQHLTDQGYRVRRTMAHPVMVAAALRSPRWRCVKAPRKGQQVLSTSKSRSLAERFMDSRVLRTYAFEYQPPAPADA